MKNDDTLRQYLEASGWDLKAAMDAMYLDHDPMDQVTMMKVTRMEQMMEERNVVE